jgi:hypothetical protein
MKWLSSNLTGREPLSSNSGQARERGRGGELLLLPGVFDHPAAWRSGARGKPGPSVADLLVKGSGRFLRITAFTQVTDSAGTSWRARTGFDAEDVEERWRG